MNSKKLVRVRNETAEALQRVRSETVELFKAIDRSRFEKVDDFVEKLASIRTQRGAAIQLRERRYIDLAEVEKIELSLVEPAIGWAYVAFSSVDS